MNDIEIYNSLSAISAGLAPSKLHQHHNPADAYFAVMIGRDLGLSPAASLQNIYNVNGRPSLYADMKLALVKRHPEYAGCEIKSDTSQCTITLKRKNANGIIDTVVSMFTIKDAERAKLTGKDNWKMYPQRMLKARALSYACNDLFPDAMIGLISAEEAADLPKAKADKDQPQDTIIDVPTQELKQVVEIESNVIETEPEHAPATEPVDDLLEIKKAIAGMLTSMIESNLDGFSDEARRHNSFLKHLNSDTVRDCQDFNALVAYHDHLAAKMRGVDAKPTIKQRQDAIVEKLNAMAITGEELEHWTLETLAANRHAALDVVDEWIAKAEATNA